MSFPARTLSASEFPAALQEIPQPPARLHLRGSLPSSEHKLLAVVGSRKYTDYGKQVVEHLISGLHGYPVSIVSGLALGIDGLAHKAALQTNLHTLAVPGSGLDDSVLYPRSHRGLASEILNAGGGLLSEFEPTFTATPWSFPQRNRIMAGLADATLIIEATEKSGTLITARMATDYNRELLVVPGSIFSRSTAGTHQFLKLGAVPVTSAVDIIEALHIDFEPVTQQSNSTMVEPRYAQVLAHLIEPCERDQLIQKLSLPAAEANVILMEMELAGIIKTNGSKIHAV